MEVLKSTGFIDQLTKKLKLSEVAQSGALNLRLAALVRTRLTVNPSPRVNNHCTVHLCKCALRTAQRCVLIKTVAFIAGKKNPADQNFYIRFSIENLIVNISFYALS